MIYYDTPEFQRLKAEWYRKARESGFDDIEYSEDCTMLPGVSTALLASEGLQWVQSKAEYFYQAEHWIPKVRAGKRRRVWKLHSQGFSVRAIAHKTDVKRSTVHYWISGERSKMLGRV